MKFTVEDFVAGRCTIDQLHASRIEEQKKNKKAYKVKAIVEDAFGEQAVKFFFGYKHMKAAAEKNGWTVVKTWRNENGFCFCYR